MEWLVRVKSREGLLYESLLEPGELKLGRAFDNDVIVDDEFVEPYQLSILLQEGDQPVISLKQSTNNILLNGKPTGVGEHRLEKNTRIKTGHTQVEILDVNSTLTPARKMMYLGNISTLRHLAYSVVAVLGTFLVVATDTWLSSARPLALKTYYEEFIGFFVIVLGWATAWSLVSRVLVHRHHFGIHIITGCFLVLLGYFSDTVQSYSSWLVTDFAVFKTIQLLVSALMVFVIAAISLSIATNVKRPRKWAGMLSLLLLLVSAGFQFIEGERQFFQESYLGDIKPPFINIPVKSVEQYAGQSEELFAQLQVLVEEHEEEFQAE